MEKSIKEKSIKEKWDAVAAIEEPLSPEEKVYMAWVVSERIATSGGTVNDLLNWMGSSLAAVMHTQHASREIALGACDVLGDMAKQSVKFLYDPAEAAEATEDTTPETDEEQ
ncbi:MAG: hypothetical protein K2H03_07050 [Muribaculaceae bacterium]|nr:hypothetical protein [Muribaculaceae bacterium]